MMHKQTFCSVRTDSPRTHTDIRGHLSATDSPRTKTPCPCMSVQSTHGQQRTREDSVFALSVGQPTDSHGHCPHARAGTKVPYTDTHRVCICKGGSLKKRLTPNENRHMVRGEMNSRLKITLSQLGNSLPSGNCSSHRAGSFFSQQPPRTPPSRCGGRSSRREG